MSPHLGFTSLMFVHFHDTTKTSGLINKIKDDIHIVP